MNLTRIQDLLRKDKWGVEVPGQFGGIDFNLVAHRKVLALNIYLCICHVPLLDMDTVGQWKIRYDLIHEETRSGLLNLNPKYFILCILAQEAVPEIVLAVKHSQLGLTFPTYYAGGAAGIIVAKEKNKTLIVKTRTIPLPISVASTKLQEIILEVL